MAPALFFYILLIVLIPNTNLSAADHEDEVLTGLNECYHFRWSKAEEIFQSIINKYPDDPEGYHYLSGVYFWYYLGNKNDNDFEKFKKLSDEAIDKAKNKLDKNEQDASSLYIIGSSYNYRTVAFAKAGNYVDAVWAAKKSETYLSDCLQADSVFYDAYFGLGLYNYAMANIPSGFKWVLNLAGIKGNEKKGLRYIRITSEKGKYAKTEAKYYLAQILSDALMEPEKASSYLGSLIKKYPENILFNYSMAAAEIKKKNPVTAERILQNIVKSKNNKFSQIIALSGFLLGDVNFRENKFGEAVKYYQGFLNSASDKDYTGIASLRLALSFEILGDRRNAVIYFKHAQKGNPELEDDAFAARKGEIYSDRTVAETEKGIIKAANMIESGSFSKASEQLQNLIAQIKTEKLKAEAYYLLSESQYYMNDFKNSLDNALKAAGMNTGDEKWIAPYSWFNAARSAYKAGDKKNAQKYLKEAKEYSSFDYQKKLDGMLNNLEKNL